MHTKIKPTTHNIVHNHARLSLYAVAVAVVSYWAWPCAAQPAAGAARTDTFLKDLRAAGSKLHDAMYRNIRISTVIQSYDLSGQSSGTVRTLYLGDDQSSLLTVDNEVLQRTTHSIIRGDAEYQLVADQGQSLRVTKSQLFPQSLQEQIIATPRYKFTGYDFNSGLGFGLAYWQVDYYSLFTEVKEPDGSTWSFSVKSITDCVEDGKAAIRVDARFPQPTPKTEPPFGVRSEFYFSPNSLVCFKYRDHLSNGAVRSATLIGDEIDNVNKFVPRQIVQEFVGPQTGGKPVVTRRVEIVEYAKLPPDPSSFRLEQFGVPELSDLASRPRRLKALLRFLGVTAGLGMCLALAVRYFRSRARRSNAGVGRSGFTLLELLVAVAIVGVLVALMAGAILPLRLAAPRPPRHCASRHTCLYSQATLNGLAHEAIGREW
ncbi:hypothetical protein GobsT_29210 [Gemmata obscuriglobus]|nr:hypothetical protein GobsT_29210 [Gemmata obscuriglobus]VTS05827.1 : N_methyl_2 [Gemmata obscuriglobus UQM 2246]